MSTDYTLVRLKERLTEVVSLESLSDTWEPAPMGDRLALEKRLLQVPGFKEFPFDPFTLLMGEGDEKRLISLCSDPVTGISVDHGWPALLARVAEVLEDLGPFAIINYNRGLVAPIDRLDLLREAEASCITRRWI